MAHSVCFWPWDEQGRNSCVVSPFLDPQALEAINLRTTRCFATNSVNNMSVLQGLLRQDSCFEIVMDNARTHLSQAKSSCAISSADHHQGMRRPQRASSPAKSRWECGTTSTHDHAPLAKQGSPSTTIATGSSSATKSICCNVTKPVRRRSIENTDFLKQLHGSLSFLEEGGDDSSTTRFANITSAELLALALEELDSSFELLLEESSTSDSSALMEIE